MDVHLDYNDSPILQNFAKHINPATPAAVTEVAGPRPVLPPVTTNLVLIRTSQINGCAVCYCHADQLAALVCTIAVINAYKFNVVCPNEGGYQPGQRI